MAATHVLVALMTAAATTSGFLAPQLAPAMHLSPLRSMAEGEGDWPSDSAEDAAPDVIDVPRVEDRESLKKELLLAVSRTARGQQLDKRPNEAVNDVARRLEAQGAPTDAQLLNGRWNLAYCSTYLFRSSPFWMAGRAACQDGEELCGNQSLRPFVLHHRVVLHAIDATPARWRGGARSSPLDGASTAAPSPRNDLVKNCRCARHTG